MSHAGALLITLTRTAESCERDQASQKSWSARRRQLEERRGFEPLGHCCPSVFKTDAIDHSAISPGEIVLDGDGVRALRHWGEKPKNGAFLGEPEHTDYHHRTIRLSTYLPPLRPSFTLVTPGSPTLGSTIRRSPLAMSYCKSRPSSPTQTVEVPFPSLRSTR